MADRITSWADLAPRLKAASKRGDQKKLAARYDLTSDQISRYLSATTSPDPVVAHGIVRDLLGMSIPELLGQPSRDASIEVGPTMATIIPIVAKEVAAGQARIPLIDEIGPNEAYFFREDWLRQKHGWNGRTDRFFCIRLARTSHDAGSMEPTIWADSIVLCDRHPAIARTDLRDRSIWLVNDGSGLAVKRVTRQDGSLLLESDAVGRRYAPRILPMKGKDITHVLPGKVIWWGTNAIYAEER